jgi:hypothetical protein
MTRNREAARFRKTAFHSLSRAEVKINKRRRAKIGRRIARQDASMDENVRDPDAFDTRRW